MQEFADFAQQLADIATPIVMEHYRTHIAPEAKGDGSPVTVADRNAEEALREHIQRTYPAHGIIGEEYGTHQPDAEFRWTLDPIDGTKNYVAGTPLFGTLIGLLRGDTAVLGLLHFPALKQTLLGYDGMTYLNGEKVTVRPCSTIEDSLFLSSVHWEVERYRDLARYETLTRRARLYRTWGDCYGYYLVATGYADVMVDAHMHFWDVVPLVPVIEGAGGRITDWFGGNPIISGGENGAVVTAGTLHHAIITALNG